MRIIRDDAMNESSHVALLEVRYSDSAECLDQAEKYVRTLAPSAEMQRHFV